MPKTYNNLWEQVVIFENLYEAYLEARKGKRYRDEVLLFGSNLEENLINLQNHLLWKSWRPGRFYSFYVHDPKKRLIQAPPFQDRVVHHALVRVIEPFFERKFIYDSYACRKGKGTHAAVQRLQSFLRRARRNWDRVYVLTVKNNINPSKFHS
jgi:retron-type reverse transcriptase